MEPTEWDPEYFGEDFPVEWGDAEFLPGLPGFPSPSAALARRFFPPRRLAPSRPARRPVGGPPPMTAVLDRIRALDERQRATATQLAVLQQRSAAQQSSETFGPLATGAVGAFALGIKNRDAFSPLVTHGLPMVQLLLASRGRAISSGFRANPWSTLGFPIAAVLLTLFRDKIPGFAPKQVDQPEVSSVIPNPAGGFFVTVKRPKGSVLRLTGPALAVPLDPDTNAAESPNVLVVPAGETVKFRAFVDGTASDVVVVKVP